MLNDHLVNQLVRDLKPVRRRSVGRDVLIVLAIGAVELVLFFAVGAMRPDIDLAMELPEFWWKLSSLGLITMVGGAVAISSFDPIRSPRRGLRWLAALIAVCLATGWFVDASRAGWSELAARLNWYDGLNCVCKMVVLSTPILAGLGLLMRRGAATDTAGSALAVGVAAAAWGAFVFVFNCPYDDPLYVAVWYGAGCSLVTMLARLLLPSLTRW